MIWLGRAIVVAASAFCFGFVAEVVQAYRTDFGTLAGVPHVAAHERSAVKIEHLELSR